MTEQKSSSAVRVRLIWIEKRIQYWLLFGEPVSEEIIDRRRKWADFKPGQRFALIRWKANDYGTVFSSIDILETAESSGDEIDIRCIKGEVKQLLSIKGWPKVKRVMELVDAIKALDIPPEQVCPDHWSHVQSRLMVGDEPRPYDKNRHHIWMSRAEYQE